MSTTMIPPGLDAGMMAIGPALKTWTVAEYHQLIERGVILSGAPIELIDGMLLYKDRGEGGKPMTYGPRNAMCVRRLASLDSRFAPHGFPMRTQLPITIEPNHEPEPDGAIVRGSDDQYREHHPGPGDCLVVMEAADTSLERDRRIKQRAYAAAGIPEYWIVNLPDGATVAVRVDEVLG